MRHNLVFTLCIILCIPFIGSAQPSQFESRYAEVQSKLIIQDSEEAFRVADSLLLSSDTDLNKIKSQTLLSVLHKSVGTYAIAVSFAQRAEALADRFDLIDHQINAELLLASIYREIGVFEASNQYLDQVQSKLNGVSDSTKKKHFTIKIRQEEAYQLMNQKQFEKAIDLIQNSVKEIDEHDFGLQSQNQIIISDCLLALGKYKLGLSKLKSVLNQIHNSDYLNKPFILQLLSETYYQLGDIDSCRQYLDAVNPYVKGSNNAELKKRYYHQEAQYYNKIADPNQALRFINQYYEIDEQRRNTAEILGNKLVKESFEEIQQLKQTGLIVFFTLLIAISGLVAYYFIKLKPKQVQIKEFIPVQYPEENPMQSLVQLKQVPKDILNLDSQISLETETRLVKKLNELEDEKFYLMKNITLSSLTNRLNTNQKYVSYIVRKYKNQHFNDYILNLRIQYIVSQLESNKIMLDYKLSYLADVAGFSSHSKFTIAFKSVMDMTPSQFIEKLKAKNG